jgi:hypothetical protein
MRRLSVLVVALLLAGTPGVQVTSAHAGPPRPAQPQRIQSVPGPDLVAKSAPVDQVPVVKSASAVSWPAPGSVDLDVPRDTGNPGRGRPWVQFTMPSARYVNCVDLFPRNDPGNVGNDFPANFTIQMWTGRPGSW